MRILGIDAEKCTQCERCVEECPAMLFSKDETGAINYANPSGYCILCGHCVAACPSDAILGEKMDDVEVFPGAESPEELVPYENFRRLLRAKRSIRRYKPDPLPTATLDQIFAAMRYAPAGSNMRTLKYVVISDREKLHDLSDAISQELARHPIFGLIYGTIIERKKAQGLDPIFLGAPHVVMAHSTDSTGADRANATIALTYGMLAAQTLGIGSCWCGFCQIAMTSNQEIKRMAGIRGTMWGAIMLGYPDAIYYRAPARPALKIKQIT